MATHISNGPCPECGSKDNLASYDDGSKWCWGCHYYCPPEGRSLDALKNSLTFHDKGSTSFSVPLPDDSSAYIPPEVLKWLKKYGLTNHEISENKFLYSQSQRKLLFPVFDSEGDCIFWQGRCFDPEAKRKYDTKGNSKDLLVEVCKRPTDGNLTCTVVEDVVSAIKVGRQTTAVPLFGSHVDLRLVMRLCKRYEQCLIWLDPDKLKEATKFAQKYSVYFKKGCFVIVSDKDPKEHSDQEIQELLKEYLDDSQI